MESARLGGRARPDAGALAALAVTLRELLGERLLSKEAQLRAFASGEGHHGEHMPDLVARVRSTEEVRAVVAACAREGVPIVPYGAGTSLEGNAAAVAGGLCLDLSSMDRVLEIDVENMLCVVEPGVTRGRLNEELRHTGLWFPVDPGADATLAGMISTRASGTTAIRYGTMRENTLGLSVVLADGGLVRTGTRARKTAAGYDLTHLFVGAEGTLGVVTEATVRLHPVPESVLAATWPFETLDGAVRAVMAMAYAAVPVARVELLDEVAIRACNAHSAMSLPELPTLFIELHGAPAQVDNDVALLTSAGVGMGAGTLSVASDAQGRASLWRARHAALPAARALFPGASVWTTDVCVPVSRLAEVIGAARRGIDGEGLTAPIVGHVGDGNFHVFFVLPPGDLDAQRRAASVNEAMVEHALSVGGTCTGEHGIGIGKQDALVREHGVEAVALMRRLKAAVDPAGIMNPGKIFI